MAGSRPFRFSFQPVSRTARDISRVDMQRVAGIEQLILRDRSRYYSTLKEQTCCCKGGWPLREYNAFCSNLMGDSWGRSVCIWSEVALRQEEDGDGYCKDVQLFIL